MNGISILAHRGLWKDRSARNTPAALGAAMNAGFGIETDIRDAGGRIVVSHDLPTGGEQGFDALLHRYVDCGRPGTLALNVKSDGLAAIVRSTCESFGVDDYFCFDMSVPDARSYIEQGLPTYARLSEFEVPTRLVGRCSGIWLDAFEHDWYSPRDIDHWLDLGKHVCIVSPELHGRPFAAAWDMLRAWWQRSKSRASALGSRLSICTDHPQEFREMLS